jgi:RRXRR protein
MGRSGAGGPTSSASIGEEYHTSARMVNVMLVYELNYHRDPFMPCQPRKARLLLQEGKARVVRWVPFTIPLLYVWQQWLQIGYMFF